MNKKGPTFVIIGAAKSGTTALYRWLQQHPQVYMSENKQPHYLAGLQPCFTGPGDQALNRDIVTDPARYGALFAPGMDRKARGEASPFYLYYPEQLAATVMDQYPSIRLVVLLRHPVSRAYAGYLHLVRDGRESESFPRALQLEQQRLQLGWEPLWAHRGLGLYGAQIQSLLTRVPADQLGVWLYDDLQQRPRTLFAEVCRFIGVDDRFTPQFTHHNTGGVPRYPALHRLLVRLRVPHLAKRVLPEPMAQWVVARYLQRRPPAAEVQAELTAYFAEDQALLARLLPQTSFAAWS